MDPRISLITLGVGDVRRSVEFYTDVLGLVLSPNSVEGSVAFFELRGTWLSLFKKEELMEEARTERLGTGTFSLSHNLASKEEVEQFFEMIRKKGVVITREPADTSWGGFTGYFSDPDGFLWEVCYNPFMWVGPEEQKAPS